MTVNDDYGDFPLVWLKEYRTFGRLFWSGAHVSEISFILNGEAVSELIENDEWEYENDTDYESE